MRPKWPGSMYSEPNNCKWSRLPAGLAGTVKMAKASITLGDNVSASCEPGTRWTAALSWAGAGGAR